jgi:hypothetical protein
LKAGPLQILSRAGQADNRASEYLFNDILLH